MDEARPATDRVTEFPGAQRRADLGIDADRRPSVVPSGVHKATATTAVAARVTRKSPYDEDVAVEEISQGTRRVVGGP